MTIERYRLTLTHTIIEDGKSVDIDEPKVFEVHNMDMNNNMISGYKNYLLDQLFTRFRRELKEQK